MPVAHTELPETPGATRSTAAADWLAATLRVWQLPPGLGRAWLGALQSALAAPDGRRMSLEYDDALALVSVEISDGAGVVLLGLDDWVGQPG